MAFDNKALKAPLQVDFNLTNRCNLECDYCYASANERFEEIKELKRKEIFNLFKEFSEIGVLKVSFSGGEPLLRKDIKEIILLSKDFPFTTILLTNGTLISEEIAKAIKKAKVSLVNVSLEGPKAEIHDKIRGKNSFNKALQGIKILKEKNITFSIGTTLNSINITHIFEMIDFVAALGAKLFAIQVLCPVGRIAKNREIIPNHDVFKNFFLKLTDLKKKSKLPIKVKVNVTNESPVFWEYYYPLDEIGRINDLVKIWGVDLKLKTGNQISCVAARTVCSIDANGDVYPCEMFLGNSLMVAGNIRKLKFKEIWQNAPIFREFRSLVKDKLDKPCRNCFYEWCGGGCRAAALFLTGSIKGADFHCIYANKK